MFAEGSAWLAKMGQRQEKASIPLDAIACIVVASAPNKWVQIPLEAWTRGTDRTQPFSLGQQKKATPLRYADHVGLPRAACGMVSSVGSRWY